MPDTAIYSIGAVATMVGVPSATLRSWEERYGVVQPVRSDGGHRLYSRLDVERLRFLADRIAEGMSAGDAHRLLERTLRGPNLPITEVASDASILLAERDPYAAEFAQFFLKTEGWPVVLAVDAHEAERALERGSPGLAIIDLLISGGAGLGLCGRVHRRGLPVLAVSTLATPDTALDAGAAAFLQKPLEPLQLVSTVKDLLGQSAFLGEVARTR
jgi:DNA-binding transcriptional MerR regulator